jgi:hypothetical protein
MNLPSCKLTNKIALLKNCSTKFTFSNLPFIQPLWSRCLLPIECSIFSVRFLTAFFRLGLAMTSSDWIEYLRLGSFFASTIGLFILYNDESTQTDFGEANWNLLAFSFGYWIVNCIAHSIQLCVCPSWSMVVLSLKFTSLFSFLLTFSCAISLPLNKVAAKHRTEP